MESFPIYIIIFSTSAFPAISDQNYEAEMKKTSNDGNKPLISPELDDSIDGLKSEKPPERRQSLMRLTAPELFDYETSVAVWSRGIFILPHLVKGGYIYDKNYDASQDCWLVRVYRGKTVIPGYIRYAETNCHVAVDGKDVSCEKLTFEYMFKLPDYKWVERKDGKLANGIVESGIDEDFVPIFHCSFKFDKGNYKGELIGYIEPSSNKCIGPLNGEVLSNTKYWVLKDTRFD